VKRGVKADSINVFSFGESDQKTQTKDGRPEKSNRRVEIFVSS
jgi:outer membrane protein OmpA-like peptidoglycan-associated protein